MPHFGGVFTRSKLWRMKNCWTYYSRMLLITIYAKGIQSRPPDTWPPTLRALPMQSTPTGRHLNRALQIVTYTMTPTSTFNQLCPTSVGLFFAHQKVFWYQFQSPRCASHVDTLIPVMRYAMRLCKMYTYVYKIVMLPFYPLMLPFTP